MIAKRFQTIEQIDQRFVWLDNQMALLEPLAVGDCTNRDGEKAKSRLKNLRHEKKVLTEQRNLLLTPELL